MIFHLNLISRIKFSIKETKQKKLRHLYTNTGGILMKKNVEIKATRRISYSEIHLDERNQLIMRKDTKIVELTYDEGKLISKKEYLPKTEDLHFELKKVDKEEIKKLRKCKKPSLLIKEYGNYYYTNIPADVRLGNVDLLSDKEQHMCVPGNATCRYLSAASDQNGGCAKVRDGSIGIERYPWITVGYETFNTKYDCFVVGSCDHFAESLPEPKRTVKEIKKLKIGLAQNIWPDVTDLTQVNERYNRNIRRIS